MTTGFQIGRDYGTKCRCIMLPVKHGSINTKYENSEISSKDDYFAESESFFV
jgi:hypothetical protein